MNKQADKTDIDILRGMLNGSPVSYVSCEVYEMMPKFSHVQVTDRKGRVKTKQVKTKVPVLVGYEPKYVQDGEQVNDVLFRSLIKRHLVVPITTGDGESQTFTVTGWPISLIV